MCAILGEGFLDLIASLGDFGVADAVGVAGLGAGAADAAGAFGGADSLSSSLDPSAATAAPGVDDLSASLNSNAGGLAGAQDISGVSGGAGQTSSTLAGGAIPEVTVTGTAPGAQGASSLAGGLPPIAASGLAASGAGGGGSGVPGTAGINGPEGGSQPLGDQSLQLGGTNDAGFGGGGDISAPADLGGGGGFLPATGDSSVQALSPDLLQSLGVDTGGDISGGVDPSLVGTPDMPATQGPGMMDDIGKWFSSPKNDATAGLLGISLKNALTKPQLPGALGAANANAAAEAKTALPVIQSGGTATPEWASQKASIDATIDNQIKQQTQQLMQAAASSGEGGQNSGIVQQQIAQMTQQANVQRQQLYAQAQQQNVQNALAELGGGDQTLTAIGSTQLQQSEQAQALSAQTAELALMLQSGSQYKLPGQGAGPPTAGS